MAAKFAYVPWHATHEVLRLSAPTQVNAFLLGCSRRRRPRCPRKSISGSTWIIHCASGSLLRLLKISISGWAFSPGLALLTAPVPVHTVRREGPRSSVSTPKEYVVIEALKTRNEDQHGRLGLTARRSAPGWQEAFTALIPAHSRPRSCGYPGEGGWPQTSHNRRPRPVADPPEGSSIEERWVSVAAFAAGPGTPATARTGWHERRGGGSRRRDPHRPMPDAGVKTRQVRPGATGIGRCHLPVPWR